jgi:hypothetical protein
VCGHQAVWNTNFNKIGEQSHRKHISAIAGAMRAVTLSVALSSLACCTSGFVQPGSPTAAGLHKQQQQRLGPNKVAAFVSARTAVSPSSSQRDSLRRLLLNLRAGASDYSEPSNAQGKTFIHTSTAYLDCEFTRQRIGSMLGLASTYSICI